MESSLPFLWVILGEAIGQTPIARYKSYLRTPIDYWWMEKMDELDKCFGAYVEAHTKQEPNKYFHMLLEDYALEFGIRNHSSYLIHGLVKSVNREVLPVRRDL